MGVHYSRLLANPLNAVRSGDPRCATLDSKQQAVGIEQQKWGSGVGD
jgi:hypothetical protein